MLLAYWWWERHALALFCCQMTDTQSRPPNEQLPLNFSEVEQLKLDILVFFKLVNGQLVVVVPVDWQVKH